MSDRKDKLDKIFAMQGELNARIGVPHDNLDDQQKVAWILNYTRALSQEISELIDSVPWKWWAKYQTFDVQNARVEAIDILHFLVSIFQVLGMSADDVFEIYCKKNAINHHRQDTGYVVKDQSDSREI